MADQSCACKSRDEYTCVRLRYNLPVSEPVDDPCTCECHETGDEWDSGYYTLVEGPADD